MGFFITYIGENGAARAPSGDLPPLLRNNMVPDRIHITEQEAWSWSRPTVARRRRRVTSRTAVPEIHHPLRNRARIAGMAGMAGVAVSFQRSFASDREERHLVGCRSGATTRFTILQRRHAGALGHATCRPSRLLRRHGRMRSSLERVAGLSASPALMPIKHHAFAAFHALHALRDGLILALGPSSADEAGGPRSKSTSVDGPDGVVSLQHWVRCLPTWSFDPCGFDTWELEGRNCSDGDA